MSDWEEPVRLPSRRKNTKVDCGGHPGREHHPIFKIDERRYRWGPQFEGCYQADQWSWAGDMRTKKEPYWRCHHIVVCERCTKILDHFPVCPVKPEGLKQLWPEHRKRWDL